MNMIVMKVFWHANYNEQMEKKRHLKGKGSKELVAEHATVVLLLTDDLSS